MLRYPFTALTFLSILFLTACSSLRPTVETDYLPFSRRERYERFAFVRHTDSLHNEIDVPFRQLVEQVVTEQLGYRGYRFDPRHPDFMVTFAQFPKTTDLDLIDLNALRRLTDRGILDHTGVTAQQLTRRHRIVEGNVMLQVYDVGKKQLIWQGYSNQRQATTEDTDTPGAQTRFLVHSVMDRFPFLAAGMARNSQRFR
jgi:hypothetical protein